MSEALTPEQQAERMDLALQCAYEIESVASFLKENLPTEVEYLFMRGMVLRVLDLNSVAMSVLGGEDGRETAEMRRVVEG